MDRLENRLDDARQHDREALKSYRQLAQQNPAAHLPSVASTLNNLGRMDQLQNRMGDARQYFEEALKIYANWRSRMPLRIYPTWPRP